MTEKEERIREAAYFLWLEEGCPEGQAQRHWQEGQRIIEARDAEREAAEGERERPAEFVTPFVTLTRAPRDTTEGGG
jgi:hypothetical protein